MELSENFRLKEFVNSVTAERHHLTNIPNGEQVLNLRNLCEQVLQPLRDHLDHPVVISSGFRSERLNELVHGVGNSQHLHGEAADLYVPNHQEGWRMYNFIRDHTGFDQLLFESRRTLLGTRTYWLHVSCKRNRRKNRFMAIPNYPVKQ